MKSSILKARNKTIQQIEMLMVAMFNQHLTEKDSLDVITTVTEIKTFSKRVKKNQRRT